MEAGLNLFSIRNLIQTESELNEVCKKLKDAGYSYLQFSGAPYNAEGLAKLSKEMPIYLTHMPLDRILNDTDNLMKEHEKFGCRNIGLGMLPISVLTDKDEFHKKVEELNSASEKMKENGFKFFYHHHSYEFYKHDGKTCFDYLIENAPEINFTVDTYWLQYGGVSVTDTLKRLKGRIECVHLKDYMIKADMTPTFAPIGDGVMDFKPIVKRAKKSGAKYFFVEQDNAAEFPDGLDQVIKSIKYLKENI